MDVLITRPECVKGRYTQRGHKVVPASSAFKSSSLDVWDCLLTSPQQPLALVGWSWSCHSHMELYLLAASSNKKGSLGLDTPEREVRLQMDQISLRGKCSFSQQVPSLMVYPRELSWSEMFPGNIIP